MKKFICLLCALCLVFASGCSKTKNNSTESAPNKAESETSSVISTETDDTTADDATTDDTSNQVPDALAMLYGFSYIEKIETYCVKNTPNENVVYSISKIITDTGEKNDLDIVLTCSNKDVVINGKTFSIPYEYTKKNKSIKLTAVHEATNVNFDFTVKFEGKWDLIFSDDFDGTEIDTTKWNIWDFTDWQYYYSPESVFLDGKGNLVNRMILNETPHPEFGYEKQTGAITTLDKFESTYGYYEIRMIPNLTSGLWSAFWLVSGDMSDKDAADDGSAVNGFEVDIVETYYYRTDPAQTIHWDGYYNDQTKSKSFSMTGLDHIFDGNYHTFAFRWTPDEYTFLIDGEVTSQTSEMGICIEPAYVLVSAHYGKAGDFVLQPNEYSDMIVDYVKVYQSPTDPV